MVFHTAHTWPTRLGSYCALGTNEQDKGAMQGAKKRPSEFQLYICAYEMSGPQFEGEIFSCDEGQVVSVDFGEEITYQCVDETLGKTRD